MDRDRLIEHWRGLPSSRQGLDNVLQNAFFGYPDIPVLHRFWDGGKPVDVLQWYGTPVQMIGNPPVERQRAFPLTSPGWDDWEAIHPTELRVLFVGERRSVPASLPIEQDQAGMRFQMHLCADSPLVVVQLNHYATAGGIAISQLAIPLPVIALGKDGILIRPRPYRDEIVDT